MDEGQRHKFGESARFLLDPGYFPNVENPVRRGIHVAVHDGAGRLYPQSMGGLYDLFPRRRRQFSLSECPPNVVIENLRGCSGDGSESMQATFFEKFAIRDT